MDRADELAVARPAGRVRSLEQRVPRFSRWSAKGIWHRIFAAMADDGDFKYLIVDSIIIPLTSTRAALEGAEDQVLGRSRSGLSTRIHMAVRAR